MDGSRLHGLLPHAGTLVLCACAWLVIWVLVRTVVSPGREWIFYRKQGIKGPPFRPLLGNLVELRKIRGALRPPSPIDGSRFAEFTTPHTVYWADTYAPGQQRLLFQTLTTTTVVLWDAGLVREFLTKHSCYWKPPTIKVLGERLAGKGLALMETPEWAPQRKLLNPGFRLHFLKGFHEYMTQAGKELVQDWLQEVHQGDGRAAFLITPGVKKAGVLETHSMDKLRIMGMVLNEVLRLYPPVAVLSRVAVVRHKIGDLDILPGTEVVFHIALIQGCDKYWNDPLAFKPERFEHGIAAASLNRADAFMPFSGGPRICIGQNFALLAAKSLVASLVHRFSFGVSPKYKHLERTTGIIPGRVALVVEELKG